MMKSRKENEQAKIRSLADNDCEKDDVEKMMMMRGTDHTTYYYPHPDLCVLRLCIFLFSPLQVVVLRQEREREREDEGRGCSNIIRDCLR